ncbi:MAG: FAD-binding oxidoreductase [Chlamydiae bacterium]|nr:FAD-binding oxidoreductase [Chlamydiota bacterium]
MKIAIIGAGFSGLACCFYLLQNQNVTITVYDRKGVGGGASAVASGLIHPYPGLDGKRSQFATEALLEAKNLIQMASVVNQKIIIGTGIIRRVSSEQQKENFLRHIAYYGDVKRVDEKVFLIESGMTISPVKYLQALKVVCEEKGAIFKKAEISSLADLSGYDRIVVAAGYGVKELLLGRPYKLNYIKGQTILCKTASAKTMSIIEKGYMAISSEPNCVEIGSTYERNFLSESPCLETALALLKPKLETFCPNGSVVNCFSGVRVTRVGHYLPISERMNEKVFLLTAMGSRGLLYHAYFGRKLANLVTSSV